MGSSCGVKVSEFMCMSACRQSRLGGAGVAWRVTTPNVKNRADGGATYHHMRPSLRLVRLLLQLDRTQRKH
jgi:hypothetical protein